LKHSDEATIQTTLETKALDKGGKGGHAIIYVHEGGFVAAAVLIQQAVTWPEKVLRYMPWTIH
jgi:hypothetical protein